MRQIDGVIFEAIYYDVVRTSSAIIRVSHAHRLPVSTYEADAIICRSIYTVYMKVISLLPRYRRMQDNISTGQGLMLT